jgi:predicted MFS family arabinose efflux permease
MPGSLLYILGTALVAFSRNIAMLLCGRFFLGASVGMIQPGTPSSPGKLVQLADASCTAVHSRARSPTRSGEADG